MLIKWETFQFFSPQPIGGCQWNFIRWYPLGVQTNGKIFIWIWCFFWIWRTFTFPMLNQWVNNISCNGVWDLNACRYALGYHWWLIGNDVWAFCWWPWMWPMVTLNGHIHGHDVFDSQFLRNGSNDFAKNLWSDSSWPREYVHIFEYSGESLVFR